LDKDVFQEFVKMLWFQYLIKETLHIINPLCVLVVKFFTTKATKYLGGLSFQPQKQITLIKRAI